MADPHPEEPTGGSEAEGSALDQTGGRSKQTPPPPDNNPTQALPTKPDRAEGAVAPGLDSPTSSPPGKPAPSDASGRKSSLPLALRLRRAHAALAPWVLAPLLLTVSTGLAYRLLRDWGGLGRDSAHGLMVLHEGEWLRHWFGPSGETLYVLANGLGLLWMLATGGAMLWQRSRRPGDRGRGDT
jgi:hypothetical protein